MGFWSWLTGHSEKESDVYANYDKVANYSEIFSSMEDTFDILTNTEFKFGKLMDAEGKEKELTDSNYTYYLKDKFGSKFRCLRRDNLTIIYGKDRIVKNNIDELYEIGVNAVRVEDVL